MENNKIVCHCCGNLIEKEDFLSIEKVWGYFSRGKDGQKHQINLCEACYDRWIQGFKYAPDVTEITELM